MDEDDEDNADNDVDFPSAPPFSKDHNKAPTLNYGHLITERCSRVSVAEALACSARFALSSRRSKVSASEVVTNTTGLQLDARAFRRIRLSSPDNVAATIIFVIYLFSCLASSSFDPSIRNHQHSRIYFSVVEPVHCFLLFMITDEP
ncbi:hypothetical protein CONPUDRAFT_156787 [Coniophora puteana RWD-64-598 SS2]|uniref:Uncharacterized protein n=1 Tax=Coniophora puteana (strain RWD-64-598) TaxID=741705 RepID=A0A5M3MEC7_CONPW|nr:uncharacterized protein CONPUDRAFT_156787 [Coniophora puteana RWD-64-598 SS2]EIW77578.1 hypothetical protein CONPUDRAFT_156787 [Coniophora puteana RWD-64-598 SS2]